MLTLNRFPEPTVSIALLKLVDNAPLVMVTWSTDLPLTVACASIAMVIDASDTMPALFCVNTPSPLPLQTILPNEVWAQLVSLEANTSDVKTALAVELPVRVITNFSVILVAAEVVASVIVLDE